MTRHHGLISAGRVTLAVAALALALPASAAAALSFSAPREAPLGIVPVAVAAEARPGAPATATIALVASDGPGETGPAAIVLLRTDEQGRIADSVSAPLPPGSSPRNVALADLDRDGVSEAVVASTNTNALSLVRRTGVGLAVSEIPLPAAPNGVAVGDLDRDGWPDLVVSTFDAVVLVRGDGAGGFAAPQVVGPAVGGIPHLSDLNHDGRLDLASGKRVLLGDGAGGFGPPLAVGVPDAGIPGVFVTFGDDVGAIADMTGEGDLDLVMGRRCSIFPRGSSCGRPASVLVGDGQGGFGSPIDVPGLTPTGQLGGFVLAAVADMDRDGLPDVLLTPPSFGSLQREFQVVPGLGEAQFAAPVTFALTPGDPAEPSWRYLVTPVDVNGDGAPDIVDPHPGALDILLSLPVVRADGLDFGDQAVGTSGPVLPLEVRNAGPAPLLVAGAVLAGPAAGDFSVVADECSGQAVAAGAACTLRLRFRPSAVGARAAELVLSDDAADSPQRVPLVGAGLAPLVAPAPSPPPSPPPPPPTTPPAPPQFVRPLPMARTTCAVLRRGTRVGVTCALRLTRTSATLRVALRLVRVGRVHATANARRAGRVPLRVLRPILPGRYTLVTVVVEGSRSRQTRQPLVVRALR